MPHDCPLVMLLILQLLCMLELYVYISDPQENEAFCLGTSPSFRACSLHNKDLKIVCRGDGWMD